MLHQLLEKLGIRDYAQLSSEERRTYEEWAAILTNKEPTIEDMRKLVATENARAGKELGKLENGRDRDLYFKVLHRMTGMLIAFLDTPASRSDQLRNHLKEAFHIDV